MFSDWRKGSAFMHIMVTCMYKVDPRGDIFQSVYTHHESLSAWCGMPCYSSYLQLGLYWEDWASPCLLRIIFNPLHCLFYNKVNLVLQQDNTCPHYSHITQQDLQDIQQLPCLVQSPDVPYIPDLFILTYEQILLYCINRYKRHG